MFIATRSCFFLPASRPFGRVSRKKILSNLILPERDLYAKKVTFKQKSEQYNHPYECE